MDSPAHSAAKINAVATETIFGWDLSKNARRALLAVHVSLTCVWLGALVVTMLLVGVQLMHPVAAG